MVQSRNGRYFDRWSLSAGHCRGRWASIACDRAIFLGFFSQAFLLWIIGNKRAIFTSHESLTILPEEIHGGINTI